MLFRVGYTFIGKKNTLRSSALIIEAKDVKEAQTRAETQLKAEDVQYQIGKVTPWTK